MPKPKPDPDVEMAISDLRRFHLCGKYLFEQGEYSFDHFPPEVRQQLDERPRDTWLKFRAFADPVNGYTPKELDTLCKQCLQYGCVWGAKHVIMIVRAKKTDGLRDKVQLRAIKEDWSANRLANEIRKLYGRRRQGGRRRPTGTDESDVLHQVEPLCESWVRWYRDLTKSPVPGKRKQLIDDLTPKTRAAIIRASRAVIRLHDYVTGRLATTRCSGG